MTLHPDEQIPGYSNPARVGRGGSSTVYRATQVSLQRDVAIKYLLVDLSAEDDARRFTTECALLGRLGEHPNVIDVHDAGVTASGTPYIVMRYCSRGTYADQVRRDGPMAVDDVLDVGIKIASALQYAHERGVIHRDIKPENILVSDSGEPILADFGVATVADAAGNYTTSIAFSRAHAAPEVLDRNAFGVASDVYSLGSTLYLLLTGRAAFYADTEARQIIAILNDPVPEIDRADVPEPVRDVIRRAMSKSVEDRPASADVLATELRTAAGRTTSMITRVPDVPVPASPAPSGIAATDQPPMERAQPPLATTGSAEIDDVTRRKPRTAQDQPKPPMSSVPPKAPKVLLAEESSHQPSPVPPQRAAHRSTAGPTKVSQSVTPSAEGGATAASPTRRPRRRRRAIAVVAVILAAWAVATATMVALTRSDGSTASADAQSPSTATSTAPPPSSSAAALLPARISQRRLQSHVLSEREAAAVVGISPPTGKAPWPLRAGNSGQITAITQDGLIDEATWQRVFVWSYSGSSAVIPLGILVADYLTPDAAADHTNGCLDTRDTCTGKVTRLRGGGWLRTSKDVLSTTNGDVPAWFASAGVRSGRFVVEATCFGVGSSREQTASCATALVTSQSKKLGGLQR